MVFVPDLAAEETFAIVFMLFVSARFISALGLVPSARSLFIVGFVFIATATTVGFVLIVIAGYFELRHYATSFLMLKIKICWIEQYCLYQ
jgi:hypothetical protein